MTVYYMTKESTPNLVRVQELRSIVQNRTEKSYSDGLAEDFKDKSGVVNDHGGDIIFHGLSARFCNLYWRLASAHNIQHFSRVVGGPLAARNSPIPVRRRRPPPMLLLRTYSTLSYLVTQP